MPHPNVIANNAAPMTPEACTLPLNAAATGSDDAFAGHPQVLVDDVTLNTSPNGPGCRQHPAGRLNSNPAANSLANAPTLNMGASSPITPVTVAPCARQRRPLAPRRTKLRRIRLIRKRPHFGHLCQPPYRQPFSHTDTAHAASTTPSSDRVQSAFPCSCRAWTKLRYCTYSPTKGCR